MKKRPLEEYLVKDSNRTLYSGIKKRIIDGGLLIEKCAVCDLDPNWCGKRLVLQIDHINGDCFDHRIENLRLLCPNCHSQTETFAARQLRTTSKTERRYGTPRPIKALVRYFCSECGKEIKGKNSKSCKECYNTNRKKLQSRSGQQTKIKWPPINELLDMLSRSNYFRLAKELGISDNAIRKHIKKHANKTL